MKPMKRTFLQRLADWWAGVPWHEPTAQERAEAAQLLAQLRQGRGPQP